MCLFGVGIGLMILMGEADRGSERGVGLALWTRLTAAELVQASLRSQF